jgi:Rps23 Pro-64 3,4-dihydroxylase Tpa1-like proline 4-hydroxylase
MTPKQILDSFSETLMQDARILSAQEQTLLTTLLRHAGSAAGTSSETQEAVRAVIASAVGETVAQRAFAVLGESIVKRILSGSTLTEEETPDVYDAKKTSKLKQKPLTDPATPSTPSSPAPQPPKSTPLRENPVAPTAPQPPKGSIARFAQDAREIAVQTRPSYLKARCVVLDEFLAPQELEELTRFTLEHEPEFRTSEVISPTAESGVVSDEHRRSRVLMDAGRFQQLMLERIRGVMPEILEKLAMEKITVSSFEAQITASNDGDFFRSHNDNGSETVASRYLTFVYFFHREPRQFEGGNLRIHDARLEGETYVSAGSYEEVSPRQNQIVFFPCELLHEITPVKCAAGQFADSRFTLNGWLHR